MVPCEGVLAVALPRDGLQRARKRRWPRTERPREGRAALLRGDDGEAMFFFRKPSRKKTFLLNLAAWPNQTNPNAYTVYAYVHDGVVMEMDIGLRRGHEPWWSRSS